MNIYDKKEEIKKYLKSAYQTMEHNVAMLTAAIDESQRSISLFEFEEKIVIQGNCFEGFFEQINVCRFGNKVIVELQKLGDFDGFYKEWATHKYMDVMKEVCEAMDEVYISNYEYTENDPMFRAFFIALLFDLDEYEFYEQIYKYCHTLCQQIENLVERRIKGNCWLKEFETNEMLFCKMYLTPFFKNVGFEKVIFNHGNKEFGKDYILVTKNIFGEAEYYGVQAKAGNLSGSATSSIVEIENQINLGFQMPFVLMDGTEVFISKMIIAISGIYTENAQLIIRRSLDKYKATNVLFLSKKELENHIKMS